jgi:hypothetical protein
VCVIARRRAAAQTGGNISYITEYVADVADCDCLRVLLLISGADSRDTSASLRSTAISPSAFQDAPEKSAPPRADVARKERRCLTDVSVYTGQLDTSSDRAAGRKSAELEMSMGEFLNAKGRRHTERAGEPLDASAYTGHFGMLPDKVAGRRCPGSDVSIREMHLSGEHPRSQSIVARIWRAAPRESAP